MSDNSNIDENKLREAKEKLACHIQPPSAHATAAQPALEEVSSCGSACSVAMPSEKVRLTQMTSAGG